MGQGSRFVRRATPFMTRPFDSRLNPWTTVWASHPTCSGFSAQRRIEAFVLAEILPSADVCLKTRCYHRLGDEPDTATFGTKAWAITSLQMK
jgi:hypothetical protein